jgi:hypothetical protein
MTKQIRQGDPRSCCTEAEALAAAELAQNLMAKYGLSLAELQEISSPADACEVDD